MPRILHTFLLALAMDAALTATASPPLTPTIDATNESVGLSLQEPSAAPASAHKPFQDWDEGVDSNGNEHNPDPFQDLKEEEYIVPDQPGAAATLLKESLVPAEPGPNGLQ